MPEPTTADVARRDRVEFPGGEARGGRAAFRDQVTRLHHVFERTRDATPDALALVAGDERLSYAQLDARANRLAHHLARRGVRPGGRVGLLLERSAHTYVALLAVLKCGAAFVPIDPSFPSDRVAFIADNADLDLLVTTSDLAAPLAARGRVLALDVEAAKIASRPTTRLDVDDDGDALCYIIYTSGSTGRPKGVAVNHSSVCNFLSVCTPLYGVGPRDRVYQGMTISFDFSIEEIWPTFVVGAALVVGPTDHRKLGAALAEFLTEQRVTVLYCVPTLLATLDRDVPTLRVLNVGGEACPRDLVRRWARPGRRMLNTYGPTETTVTATWAELSADRPVTIGRPLPTYTVHLLDDDLRPVADGEAGEVCVGGPGVAVGYVGRPDLTAERFVPDPFADEPGARLYRTGDLGRLTPDGEIEYLGRADDQVKLRGYRVELAEIEAVLLESDEVGNALVALVDVGGAQELAAYVTPGEPTEGIDDFRERLHAKLRRSLPSYMVPAFVEVLDALPMLASGKADRARLPAPASSRLGAWGGAAPETPLEKELAAAWGAVFGRDDVPADADFFQDLGGHSLAAALVVSRLREKPALRHVALRDLYAHPTVRALARHAEETGAAATTPALPPRQRLDHSGRRVLVAGTAQMALLYLLFIVGGLPATALLARGASWSLTDLLAAGGVLGAASLVLPFLLPLALKWLLVGRFLPGRYPLWGWFYCRWWLARKALALAPLGTLAGSPLLPLYLRLLGARVGKGCHLATGQVHLPDLVEIGDGASVGYNAELQPFLVEDGWLYLAPVRVGVGAFVGANAVLMPGARVGAGACLLEQSLAARGQAIPAGETWAGSPSERRPACDPQLKEMEARPAPEGGSSPALWLGYVLGLVVLELLPLLILTPGLLLIYAVADGSIPAALAAAPVAGLVYVLTACLAIAAGKWLVMPRARPGMHPVDSAFGLRKWLVDKLMMTSLALTNTLYATLYAVPWLRLLGARVGAWSEVSTVSHFDPDLLDLGRETFVADMAAVGAARYHNGLVALGRTRLGSRTFVGNAALVPGGTRLADGVLIGVHSLPPERPAEPGTSWLGSPAIFLPRRQESEAFDENVTYRPKRSLVALRLAVEFLRVLGPPSFRTAAVVVGASASRALAEELPWPLLALALPLVYFACACGATALVAALKWLVVGRYRPRVEPLWAPFVRRNELITGLYESVAVPMLLNWLTGTPLIGPALRLFGAHIGRRVYLETTYLTEHDLVHVGDGAMIGGATSLQTHLFEDRVMKMSVLTIGAGCTVGPRSVVLYDAALGDGAVLDALSLVMKGESLPPETRWRGIPARLAE